METTNHDGIEDGGREGGRERERKLPKSRVQLRKIDAEIDGQVIEGSCCSTVFHWRSERAGQPVVLHNPMPTRRRKGICTKKSFTLMDKLLKRAVEGRQWKTPLKKGERVVEMSSMDDVNH